MCLHTTEVPGLTAEIRQSRRLSYSAVIPTKDRPQALDEAIGVLLEQQRRPERVVVVDASERPWEPPEAPEEVEIVVVRSRPSTSAQRNLGAQHVESDLVLFLDDDVRLPGDYAAALLACWEAAGLDAFGGMSGTPQVVPRQGPAGRLLRRLAMLNYVDPGAAGMTLRRSGNVRYVPEPRRPSVVPPLGAGATLYRTDLARSHGFDERFDGYAPGEDLEMAFRVGRVAPLLQTPHVRWTHLWDPRERVSPTRWEVRGRCETYFRLRRIDRSPLTLAAFAWSLVAETGVALIDTVRERDIRHVRGFVRGAAASLRGEVFLGSR
jgi:glycosyltransferase involved in cell wall biosynthesis